MKKKGIQKRKVHMQQLQQAEDRLENREDGELKTKRMEDAKKARQKPLSVLGNKALREENAYRNGPKTYGDFVIEKAKEKGLAVPTDPEKIRELVNSTRFRPINEPPPYWHTQQ